jgi:hypothetical protein
LDQNTKASAAAGGAPKRMSKAHGVTYQHHGRRKCEHALCMRETITTGIEIALAAAVSISVVKA